MNPSPEEAGQSGQRRKQAVSRGREAESVVSVVGWTAGSRRGFAANIAYSLPREVAIRENTKRRGEHYERIRENTKEYERIR